MRALEVDHIVPRSKGGADDPDNLQALCFSCNSTKRDRDATDFRGVVQSYGRREEECPFCEVPKGSVAAEIELAYAICDAYPVTSLHTLVVPKRHVRGYLELGQAEINACHRLLGQQRDAIAREDGSVEGFNVGVNDGETAGQTVFHCHLHLIPPPGRRRAPCGRGAEHDPGQGRLAVRQARTDSVST